MACAKLHQPASYQMTGGTERRREAPAARAIEADMDDEIPF
jgi:hypothetical protein